MRKGLVAIGAILLGFLLMAVPWVAHVGRGGFESVAVTASGLVLDVFGVAVGYETLKERVPRHRG